MQAAARIWRRPIRTSSKIGGVGDMQQDELTRNMSLSAENDSRGVWAAARCASR